MEKDKNLYTFVFVYFIVITVGFGFFLLLVCNRSNLPYRLNRKKKKHFTGLEKFPYLFIPTLTR